MDQHADAILAEVGGLHVGTIGAGRDWARSDLRFETEHDAASADWNDWAPELGRLVAIGSAHHEHAVILVAHDAAIYVFTLPDGALYRYGSFEEATERLLLGHRDGVISVRAGC